MTPNNNNSNNATPRGILRRRSSEVDSEFLPPPGECDVNKIELTTDQDDDNGSSSCFAKCRKYASKSTSHEYTPQERAVMNSFGSVEYLPPNSQIYRTWLRQQSYGRHWQVWVAMGLVGFLVGCTGFLLHQLTYVINELKWSAARRYLTEGNLFLTWLSATGISLALVMLSSAAVVLIDPKATSSGIPDVIAFVNGVVLRQLFTLKTYFVKFISCLLCVSAEMPVGPEGPMVHMGAIIGSCVSQLGSYMPRFLRLSSFSRLVTPTYRRNFISAGTAAGVASAFGAPVGGLLFALEDITPNWNLQLSWQIFFCSMISAFTTYLFSSAFHGFTYHGSFGAFRPDHYILFQVHDGIPVNVVAFIPAVLLGVIGGLLGSLFIFLNLKISRLRGKVMKKLKSVWKQNTVKILEPVFIMLIVGTVSVLLPAVTSCSQFVCLRGDNASVSSNCLVDNDNDMRVDSRVENYMCPLGNEVDMGSFTWTNRTYNQLATLLFGTGEKRIHHLFSRSTHLQLDVLPLFVVFVFYFLFACWSAGTFISCGLLVPMLFIGGLYGRIVGVSLVSVFGIYTKPTDFGLWMDPGAFALVGAASFFGGVTRLTMSLAVIMVELTDDIQFLLPVMTAIMVAKWVSDCFTLPYYHALLDLRCIPYLESELKVKIAGKLVNPELFSVRQVASEPVVVISSRESVSRLADVLLSNKHGGFPVVRPINGISPVYFGLITRRELFVLLKNSEHFKTADEMRNEKSHEGEFNIDYSMMTQAAHEVNEQSDSYTNMLKAYASGDSYKNLYVDLEPYVNQSTFSVADKLSLYRAYVIFRSLGLRHMVVVDDANGVVGILTRKDLMSPIIQERLKRNSVAVATLASTV